jgi:hypothetical protein
MVVLPARNLVADGPRRGGTSRRIPTKHPTMTQNTTQIRELGPDDRVRVTLDDGTELRCMAQNERRAD